MSALGTHISNAHKQVRSNLALYVEIPSLDISGASRVGRNRNYPVASILPVRCKRPRVGENAGYAAVDLCRATIGWRNCLPIKKAQSVLVSKRSFFQRFVENPITAAQHCFVVDAVGEANARAKSLLVGVLWTRLTVAASPVTKISVGSENAACSGIREIGIDH